MMFYKDVQEGYIIAILTGENGTPDKITETEYNTILDLIRNKPTAPEGYDYRLNAELTWELVELPPMPEYDEEATAEDYEAALAEVGV